MKIRKQHGNAVWVPARRPACKKGALHNSEKMHAPKRKKICLGCCVCVCMWEVGKLATLGAKQSMSARAAINIRRPALMNLYANRRHFMFHVICQ